MTTADTDGARDQGDDELHEFPDIEGHPMLSHRPIRINLSGARDQGAGVKSC